MPRRIPVVVSLETFFDHAEANDGFCVRCRDFTNVGGVEPDARRYRCEVCDRLAVFGVEEAMLCGLLAFGNAEEVSW